MKDLYSKVSLVQSLGAVVLSATSTGAAIDLSGYNSAVLVVNTGAIAGAGDFTAKLQESDTTTSGDFTDVAAADLRGALPATLAADSVYKLGYIGRKKYVRHVITKNGGTSIAASATVVKGHPELAPAA